MKRRITLTFNQNEQPSFTMQKPLYGRHSYVIEGDFEYDVVAVQRFVEVQLLDKSGVSDGQRQMTWSYVDPLDIPLAKGDYVMVPFGWSDDETIAKVVRTGNTPEYKGFGKIKKVAYRLGRDAYPA